MHVGLQNQGKQTLALDCISKMHNKEGCKVFAAEIECRWYRRNKWQDYANQLAPCNCLILSFHGDRVYFKDAQAAADQVRFAGRRQQRRRRAARHTRQRAWGPTPRTRCFGSRTSPPSSWTLLPRFCQTRPTFCRTCASCWSRRGPSCGSGWTPSGRSGGDSCTRGSSAAVCRGRCTPPCGRCAGGTSGGRESTGRSATSAVQLPRRLRMSGWPHSLAPAVHARASRMT